MQSKSVIACDMYKLTLLCVIAIILGAQALPPKKISARRPDGRIVGGVQVPITERPYQASIQAFGSHFCGGSLINPNVVLTAAHCADDFYILFSDVVLGSTSVYEGVHFDIQDTIIHELYGDLGYDVAVITLTTSAQLSTLIQVIPLATEEPAGGDVVIASGWGVLNEDDYDIPELLFEVSVNIVDRVTCASNYNGVVGAYIDETMICAGVPQGGKDSCSGDSGGPLTKNDVLVGIVSWGAGCALAGYPGVYSNVANLRAWIVQNSSV